MFPVRKHNRAQFDGAIWHLTAVEATLACKPRFNAYACGHGVHGNTKYDRSQVKREFRREIDQIGWP